MSRTSSFRLVLLMAAALLLSGLLALPAAAQADDPQILVFSKTAGFRHASIPDGIAAIQQLGDDNGWEVVATEDAGDFNDDYLAQFEAVVWLSTTGDVLNAEQQAAFERYIQGGGGYAGIHAASDTEYDWAWYGDLVGAYFDSHPAQQDANVDVLDTNHPSTAHLPKQWNRFDEWYNYQSNPRGEVHVLASLQETSYDAGGGAMGDDHPISWCQDYDGGRSWYTGLGHTSESFTEPNFVEHIKGGIETAAGLVPAECGATVWANYQAIELASGGDQFGEPIGMAVLPDGRVLYTTRAGELHLVDPASGSNSVIATIPVYTHDEDGLQGIALSPNFAEDGWLYTYYAPPLDTPSGDAPTGTEGETSPETFDEWKGHNNLSRFQFDLETATLDLDSEQVILEVPTDRGICCHVGGDIDFDADGNLYLSTGDDSNPFESSGYTPIDQREWRNPAFDAQRSAGNTNDLRGSILRITPTEDGSYTIPEGNLFAEGMENTRPEIFIKGVRNPFRIAVDKETGAVLVGDYGPDAGSADPERGPKGYVEWSMTTTAEFWGWPFCTADNKAYHDWNFATETSGPLFDCDAGPTNPSFRNDGLDQLPSAVPADLWYGDTPEEQPWPDFGSGGQGPMAGPIYNYDPDLDSNTKFPEYFDGKAFFYEWTRDYAKVFHLLDNEGDVYDITPFLPNGEVPGLDQQLWDNPMDMEFGPDGSLYVLNYGDGFFGANPDAGLFRIDYVKGARPPVPEISAEPTSGQAPLEVSFSSEGTRDPDSEGGLTYEWDFDGDGTFDATGETATHTYMENGEYQATLRVTDPDGNSGVAATTITVGNTAPEIEIVTPPDGGFFSFGDEVAYQIDVTDAEDEVDCSQVTLTYALGHNNHAHPLSEASGCEGTITTPKDDGHPATEELFGVLTATYTDTGGDNAPPIQGTDGAILNPKHLQAEHFDDSQGIQIVDRDTAQGGARVGFAEAGDWISFDPVNFTGITGVVLRVTAGGGGGPLEFRWGAPDGDLLATVDVPDTGGWETYATVGPVDLPDLSTETGSLYLVFGGGFDLDSVTFQGQGVAENAAPQVTVSAEPTEGDVPLDVAFSASATDPEGTDLTYMWDFGDGTTADTLEATHTYTEAGTYTATLTATDADGLVGSDSVTITATSQPPPPLDCLDDRSDEFEGDSLDMDRWSEIVRDNPDEYSVSDGSLTIQTDVGDIYGGTNGLENLILQPAPEGAWQATAKVTFDPVENYQKAGLVVYGDDDNFAIADLVYADGRKFEFVRETEGAPRNDGPGVDGTDTLPDDFPDTWYIRIISDGSQLTAEYSADGATWTSLGRSAELAGIDNPRIGVFALQSGNNAEVIPASFDWFHLSTSQGGEDVSVSTDFDGDSLNGCRWDRVVRYNPELVEVADSHLTLTTSPGDIFGSGNTGPENFILQTAPEGDWTIETKITENTLLTSYQQAGLMVYIDDGTYVKFDIIADQGGEDGVDRIELRSEIDDEVQNPQPQVTDDLPDNPDGMWWLRLTKSGDSYTGEFSIDGVTWTALSDPVSNSALAEDAAFGVFTLGAGQESAATASFDYFRLAGEDTGGEDTTAPTVTAELMGTQNADGAYEETVTMTVTADDGDGSGIDTIEYKVGDGDWQPYTEPVVIDEPGDYTVMYRATDVAGNTSEVGSASFTVVEAVQVECNDATEPDEGFEMLFDGTTASLDNWVQSGPGEFELTEACVLESIGGLGLFYYDEEFEAPYVLKLDWQMEGDDNSGVFVGFPDPGDDPFVAVNQGEEIQIDATDDPDATTGAIYNEQAADADAVAEALNPPGEWNTFEIAVTDTMITVYLNGVLVNEWTNDDPNVDLSTGYIGIQNHGDADTVFFRDIQINEDPDVADTVAPEVTISLDPPAPNGDPVGDFEGTYNTPVEVTIEATDDSGSVATVEFSVNGGDFQAYDGPFTVSEDGEHTIVARATDEAGNASEDASVTFTIMTDACIGSDTSDTVVIGDRDSGVPNYDLGDGCTLEDRIDDEQPFTRRGFAIRYIVNVTRDLVDEGVITRRERANIIRAAARSNLGRPQSCTQVPDSKIGVQLYTIRDADLSPAEQLQAVADAGYQNVEPFTFYGFSAEEFADMLDEYGLQAPSFHTNVDALQNDVDGLIADAQALGAQYVTLAYVGEEWRTEEGVAELADILNEAGAALADNGLQLAYHNHNFEFETTFADGRTMYETLAEMTDPDLVKFQLDLYWVVAGGADPVEVIDTYGDRIVTVHVKDMAEDGSFADVGEGTLNFARILAGQSFDYYFVENDQPDDEISSINDSYKNLRALCLGG